MNKRRILAFIGLFFILILIFIWNIKLGSVDIPAKKIIAIILGDQGDETMYNVIWTIRLPRIIAAMFLGGALAVSGFLLQTFFNNPIAGPYVLGISSGAKMLVAVCMIVLLQKGIAMSGFMMVIAAFIGSLIAMAFVLLISVKVTNMSYLVVCGIMIGYICSAITDFLVTFADDSNIVNLHNWSLGSFAGTSWEDVRLLTLIVVVTLILTFLLSKPMSAYKLGEDYAKNMGVNVKALRLLLILFSSILSATVTAFAGPVSFVGIAVPHLVKTLIKTSKPIIMIPTCFLGGAIITLLCDGIARTIFAPTELSISSVTAVFLVPVVLTMMIKKQGRR